MRFSAVIRAVVLMGICLPGAVHAQAVSISGVVMNSWDFAEVTDASITLTRSEATVTATPDATGAYRLAEVTPGVYELSVNATGFRPYVRHAVRVGGEPLQVAITLEPTVRPSVQQLAADAAARPGDYLAHFRLGRTYYLGGDLAKARQEEERAFALQPKSLAVLLGLAQLSLRQGSGEGALKYAELALTLKPGNYTARLMLAGAFFRLGRLSDGRVLLKALAADNPYDLDVQLESGVLDLAEKKYDDAEEHFRRAFVSDPESLRGLLGIAETRLLKNEPDKAIEVIAQEAQKRPESRDLQRELANLLMRVRQYEKAVATYRAVLDKFADAPLEQAEIFARIGSGWALQHDFPQSIEALKKAMQLSPKNAGYALQLASFYEQAGKAPEAMAAYQDALKLDPDNAAGLNNYAYLLSNSGGDLQEALRLAQRARSMAPDAPEILDTVGWVYLKLTMVDSAARVFEDLTDRFGNNASFHYHYGLALADKGDKVGAQKQLNLALENKPNEADGAAIRALLQKLK